MKKIVLLAFLSVSFFLAAVARDSCSLRISLLTCSPGEELYSTFGHTAIRVQDAGTGTDDVYNYGTFEFAPDFYYKFVKGKLNYALAAEDFNSFLFQYRAESRSIVEQELTLNCLQKQELYAALRTNLQPENRFYRYDFLFDNCTTRAKDIMAKNSGGTVQYRPLFTGKQPTFRHLIYTYLNKANQDWSKLGIDLLLGAKLDRQATNEEAMFLPDNLFKALDSATVGGRQVVEEEVPVLTMPYVASESYLVTPMVFFSLMLIATVLLSFTQKPLAKRFLRVFDVLFFFILGLVGLLLLFMWFGTDHALCANNYNLLWAFPTHVAAAFFITKNRGWVKHYFRAAFFLTVLLLLTWWFLPQQLNTDFLPLAIVIAFRSWMISKNSYANKTHTV